MKLRYCPVCGKPYYKGKISLKYRYEICTACIIEELIEEFISRLHTKGVHILNHHK